MRIKHRIGKYIVDFTGDLVLTKRTEALPKLLNISIVGLVIVPVNLLNKFKASYLALMFIWFK